MVNIDDYERQIDNVEYKGEIYSIRDNGAIMRHQKNEKIRPLDNKWTFGKQNKQKGYMDIGTERVHRIIATGFLGAAPTKEHLVDHIDTNRANNRPENLRWVTKFENAILNPITAKRIALVCGSVEEFLKYPENYRSKFSNYPDISWMCTVSKEEAHNCLINLQNWTKKDIQTTKPENRIGDWIYKSQLDKYNFNEVIKTQKYLDNNEYYTPNTEQDWSTPTKFYCCPSDITQDGLKKYYDNLVKGAIFGENKYTKYIVLKAVLNENKIIVITEDCSEHALKPWCVTKIIFKNNIFYHSIIGTYFTDIGAEKYFTLEQGLEWTGEESIDDYC